MQRKRSTGMPVLRLRGRLIMGVRDPGQGVRAGQFNAKNSAAFWAVLAQNPASVFLNDSVASTQAQP